MKRNLLLLTLLVALFMPWAANAQTLFSEGFEGGSMPTGWTTDGPGTWRVGSGDYSSTTGAGMGTYNALITHGNSGDVTKLITPEINLSSVTSAMLSFMHVQRSWAGDIDYLKVYYRTSSSEAWTQLVAYTGAVASWTTEEDIVLPNTTATYQLAFEYTDNYGYGVGLDQVVINAPSACPKPTLGAAEYISEEGASFQWTENGSATQWQLQYSTSADFANPTTIDRNGIPAYAITGLAASTAYYVHVRSYCGDDEWSDWSNTVVFRTLCGVYGLPYAYGFEDAGDMECWTVSGSTSASTGIASASDAPEGSKVFRFHYSEQNAYLISPVFNGTSAGLSVTFQYMNSSTTTGYTEQFQVGYTTSATETDPTAFTYGETIYGQNEWVMYENLFPANTKRIAIKYIYTNGMYLRLDDFTFEVPSDCTKPTGLALTASGNTFTATWNGTADTYNIDINGTVTNNVTSPYTFTGEYGTTYTVMVQANCGGETSGWTNPQSVTTDLCAPENMCEITYELADSYGDGWNGNTLSVVDVATTAVLATWTIPSGSSASGSLALCDGREIQFVWAGTSYPYENSFTVYDINGEIICQHIKDDVGPAVGILSNYTVSCTVSSCRKPTDLAVADITANTAVLSWTENGEATAWQVEVTDLDGGQVTTWDATTNPYQIVGLTPETPYSVKVNPVCDVEKWSDPITFRTLELCPKPTNLAANDVTPMSASISWQGSAAGYNLRYRTARGFHYDFETATPWVEDNFAPCTTYDGDGLTTYQITDWTPLGTYQFVGSMMTLQSGVTDFASAHGGELFGGFVAGIPDENFEHNDDYFILPSITIENGYVFEFWASSLLDNWGLEHMRVGVYGGNGTITEYLAGSATDYVEVPNGWTKYSYDLSGFAGQTIQLAINSLCPDAYILGIDDIFVGDPTDDTWDVTVNDVTSPYALTGLTEETMYEVQVQAACGEDGESAWVGIFFTTPSNCDTPSALEATDVMPHSATLNWTGYQDSYTVRYRTAAHSEAAPGALFEDFESASLETNGWTVLREGEGTEYTDWRVFTPASFEDESVTAHSGDYVVMGRSWSSDAYSVDNWLISPQVSLDGELSYWVLDDGQYHEHYDVYVSTTTTETSAFTLVYEPGDASDEWTQHTVDLSSYAGQQGYIAFRLVDEDKDFLFLDDITLGSVVEVPAGEWKEVEVSALPYTLENLEDDTEYEWQVQGINASCDGGVTEWSEISTFTTLNACADITNLMLDDLTATSMTLSWTGVQDSYLVQYRTAEGVTPKFFYDPANEQGDWTTDNLEENSGWDILPGYFTFYYTSNPPQTLISPELTEIPSNSTLAFDYVAYDATYPETFKVGFSTTDNSVESFTWGDEVTATNVQFLTYTVSVPDDAKYFAIQCTSDDQYALILDDFAIGAEYVEAGEWNYITVTEPTVTIDGLDGQTTYDVYVQGICGEDEYTAQVGGQVTTPKLTTVTQTIALGEGTNWVSFYVETNLNDLKAALEATGNTSITIAYNSENLRLVNGRWRGSLNFNLNRMYKITVANACEITLEGMIADPAEHPVTITPGANWIGFPLNTTMTPTVAFAGFATNGDVISYSSTNARYTGGRWRGSCDLVGGHGYIYTSAATEDRPDFVFPTSSKTFNKGANFSLSSNTFNMPANLKLQKKSATNQSTTTMKAKVAKVNKNCKSIHMINK